MRKFAAITAVVLGVLFVAAFALSRPFPRKPLDDYIAARKAAGKPVRLRDVVPAEPPPAENGATDVQTAAEWMEKHAGPRDSWTVPGPWNAKTEDWFADSTPEQLADLDRFLADAKPYFDGIDAAIAKGRIVPSLANGFDEAAYDRRIGPLQIVGTRARGASRPQDRLDGIVELAGLATRTESRALIDEMISVGMMINAVRALRDEMERGTLDVAAARTRLDPFLAIPWMPRFRTAVRMERASLLERVAAIDFDGTEPMIRRGGAAPDLTSVLMERMQARIRAMIDGETIVRYSPADFAAAHAATEPVENISAESGARAIAEVRALLRAAKPGGLAEASMRTMNSLTMEAVRTEARVRLARIALAVESLRARTGALPKSLGDVASDFPQGVPQDPFTDAPFVFTSTDAGVRIASAGRIAGDNAIDDKDLVRDALLWEWKR
jgi:hypothetical protein